MHFLEVQDRISEGIQLKNQLESLYSYKMKELLATKKICLLYRTNKNVK